MLEMVRTRKLLEACHYQEHRNIMRDGGNNFVKRFYNQFKKIRNEENRKISIQTVYIGRESDARGR